MREINPKSVACKADAIITTPFCWSSERVMVTAMCGFKLIEKRTSQEHMGRLPLEEALHGLAKVS